jgi:hypothetical protein
MRTLFLFVVLIGVMAVGLQAQEAATGDGKAITEEGKNEKQGKKYEITGASNIMLGQMVSGHSFGRGKDNQTFHQWQDFYGGDISATANSTEWLTTKIGLEVRSSFPITAVTSIMRETYRVQYRPFLHAAEGIFHWNFENQSSLFIESGIFQYNFNPDIRNLGNYLYRGIAYPLYLETKLDYPWVDLFGVRAEYAFLDKQVRVGAIVNSAIVHAPFYDFSLAFTASYTSPNKVLDIGAGLCFDRLFSVNDYITDAHSEYPVPGFDSSWTLRSTKLDTKASLDIKRLMGNLDIFGSNEAKVYGEMAILGFKDPQYSPDSTFASTLFHRMPVLVGINIPTCKILDLLTFEVEYFNSPYSNDWWGNFSDPSPVPVNDPSTDSTWRENYKTNDNIKWSIYVKKSFSKFDIIGILANDHTIYDTYSAESQTNTEQSLRTPKDWHWYIKLQYNL